MKSALIKITSGLLVAVTFISLSFAQNPAPDQEDPDQVDPPDERVEREFTAGDGVLPEHLAMYDLDKSGGLSVGEYQLMLRERRTQERQKRARDRWDDNKDGVLDAAEQARATARYRQAIIDRRTKYFRRVDTNADDHLNRDEFLAIAAVEETDIIKPGTGPELFKYLDHNHDGLISLKEFLKGVDEVRPVNVEDSPQPRNSSTVLPPLNPVLPQNR